MAGFTYHNIRQAKCAIYTVISHFGILLLLLCVSTTVKTAEQYRFCATHWPPYAYAKDSQIKSGISYELYQEIFKRLHWSVVIDVLPWSRCIKWVEKGVYSAALDSVPRKGTIHGKHPTAFFPLAVFVRDSFPQHNFSWKRMTGKRVGMVSGYVYTETIRNFVGWEEYRARDEGHMIRMLKANRLNFILLDLLSAPILSKDNNVSIRQLQPIVDSALLYPIFNPMFESQMQQFDQTLAELIEQGVADKIYRKYSPYSYKQLDKLSMPAFIQGPRSQDAASGN